MSNIITRCGCKRGDTNLGCFHDTVVPRSRGAKRPHLARGSILHPIYWAQNPKGHKKRKCLSAFQCDSLLFVNRVSPLNPGWLPPCWRRLGHSERKAWISPLQLSPSIHHDPGAVISGLQALTLTSSWGIPKASSQSRMTQPPNYTPCPPTPGASVPLLAWAPRLYRTRTNEGSAEGRSEACNNDT